MVAPIEDQDQKQRPGSASGQATSTNHRSGIVFSRVGQIRSFSVSSLAAWVVKVTSQ